MKSYDIHFLQKLKQRNDAAFATLYNETVDMFFRYLKVTYFLGDAEIDDIISAFYVKLWENLKRLDTNTWLSARMRTIFKNGVKDYFKAHSPIHFSQMKSKGGREWEWEHFEDTLLSDENMSALWETQRQHDAILRWIESLEWDYKEVIYFKFVEEKSYDEIAKILKISEQTVRQKVSRWLKKLKSLLP